MGSPTYLAELFELPSQSEGGEDWVFTGQRDERGRGQSLVDVESRAGMSQTVDLQGHRWINDPRRLMCHSLDVLSLCLPVLVIFPTHFWTGHTLDTVASYLVWPRDGDLDKKTKFLIGWTKDFYVALGLPFSGPAAWWSRSCWCEQQAWWEWCPAWTLKTGCPSSGRGPEENKMQNPIQSINSVQGCYPGGTPQRTDMKPAESKRD